MSYMALRHAFTAIFRSMLFGVPVALVILIATPVHAATVPVTSTLDSGVGTLRQAVLDAIPGDEVVFDPAVFSAPVTITLNSPIEISKSLAIAGGVQMPVINGNHAERIFLVDVGATVTLSELSLVQGFCYCNGGAIYIAGTLFLLNSTLADNWSYSYGGGIYNFGTLTVNNSIFFNNYTLYGGGGVSNFGSLTLSDSTFVSNTASAGAALQNSSIDNGATIVNSTFSGNFGPANQYSIVNWAAMTLTNSTIAGNRGGGIYSFGSLLLINTIIANNPLGGNCRYTVTDGGHNLEDANTCGLGLLPSTHSLTDTDPLLGPLQVNPPAEAIPTMELLPGSPAINTGDNITCPSTDERGVIRPQGGTCDIGAFEVIFIPVFVPIIQR